LFFAGLIVLRSLLPLLALHDLMSWTSGPVDGVHAKKQSKVRKEQMTND
jgi:hypothetical protein